MPSYIPRVVDSKLKELLSFAPAVSLTGPRGCGKTSTGRHFASSEIRLDLGTPDYDLVNLQPTVALKGNTPHLIDEWQNVPAVWDQTRRAVDDGCGPGSFILTGSAWPYPDARRHSGAGRILELPIRTLSSFEQGWSSAEVSLASLLEGQATQGARTDTTVSDYANRIVRGGWPGWWDVSVKQAQAFIRGYIDAIVTHDFPAVGGTRRSPNNFRDFLHAYATLSAHPSPLISIGRRLVQENLAGLGEAAIASMHELALRMFLIEDQPAWLPSVRSKTALTAYPKRHLADPSLAAALMGLAPEHLLRDLETLGFLFESLAVRDLRVYSSTLDAQVKHFREKGGANEIDIIVSTPQGQWAGFEVKLSHTQVDYAAASLLRIAEKIKQPPLALAVIIPSGISIRRPDGVWVIPLATLGP
ncbi:MAG: DUF4143 domain-containing protein [Actinomycetaceae bacterium]|nr:DUF4143 domain-containing protein [Actinomycetaceae bacterium]